LGKKCQIESSKEQKYLELKRYLRSAKVCVRNKGPGSGESGCRRDYL